jgi:hypothetical protein
MSFRGAPRLVPGFVAVVLFALGSPAALAAGKSKTLESHNVTWTLPSDEWSFMDVTPEQKADGYVLRAFRRFDETVYIEAYAYVAPAKGLPLADRMQELREQARREIAAPEFDRITPSKLSGLDGSVLIFRGKGLEGGAADYRYFAIRADDTFHILLVRAYNGAEAKAGDDLDALRRGYRLIKGAGPVEAAPPAGSGGLPVDEGGDGAAADAGAGPKQKDGGRTFVFDKRNFEWTLPEGTPWAWEGVTVDQSRDGVMARVRMRTTVKAKEEGKPDEQYESLVVLLAVKQRPGFDAEATALSPEVQKQLGEDLFDEVTHGRTQMERDVAIGNVRGSAVQMGGKKGGEVQFARVYLLGLRGTQYQINALMAGGSRAGTELNGFVTKLIGGIKFFETQDIVRGPFAVSGVPPHVSNRGHGEGKEKDVVGLGFTVEKPKEMTEIDYDPGRADPSLRMALEHHTKDGQAYLYFDVQTFDAAQVMRGQKKEEGFVTDRESQWRQVFTDEVQTVDKGKDPWRKDTFAREKGVGYTFRGKQDGVPYVEEGYVFKHKQQFFWVRFQYGGEGAEKKLSKLAKAVARKFEFKD